MRRVAHDDRAMMGGTDVDLHRWAAPYMDHFAAAFCLSPLALELVTLRVAGVKPFDVEVLIIGHCGGDAPGHRAIMAEVWEPRNPRER